MRSAVIAEFIGTFFLVLIGTGSIVMQEPSHSSIAGLIIAVSFGLVVTAMICAFARVSGAHINPAVTISLAVIGKCSRDRAIYYVVAQVLGAIVASLVIKLLFPASLYLGSTLPSNSPVEAWIIEYIMSAVLMLTILFFVLRKESRIGVAAITIGSVVGLEAFFGGPISGASMNPARSIGPAIVSGQVSSLWIYLTAPIAGALSAAFLALTLFMKHGKEVGE